MKWTELTPEAREKFLSDYNNEGFDGSDTIEYCKTDPDIRAQGFSIATINYSGFWSQGDGACWTGRTHLPSYIKHHWKDADTAVKREVMLALLDNDDCTRSLSIHTRGHYYHSGTMYIDTTIETYFGTDTTIANKDSLFHNALSQDILEAVGGETLLREIENEVLDAARALAYTIYKVLEDDYEYRSSEEYIAEMAEANDWDFNEEGEMI
jgi:hypothetical protein